MKKKSIIFSVILVFIILAIIIIPNQIKTGNFNSELNSAIKDTVLKDIKYTSFELQESPRKYNTLSVTFGNNFDTLTAQQRCDTLSKIDDKFYEVRLHLLVSSKLYDIMKGTPTNIPMLTSVTAKTESKIYTLSIGVYYTDADGTKISTAPDTSGAVTKASLASTTPVVSTDNVNSTNDREVWQYCRDRWDYYDNVNGEYAGGARIEIVQ